VWTHVDDISDGVQADNAAQAEDVTGDDVVTTVDQAGQQHQQYRPQPEPHGHLLQNMRSNDIFLYNAAQAEDVAADDAVTTVDEAGQQHQQY
jgi:hypothetical protein